MKSHADTNTLLIFIFGALLLGNMNIPDPMGVFSGAIVGSILAIKL